MNPTGDLLQSVREQCLGGQPAIALPSLTSADGSGVGAHSDMGIHGTTVIAVKYREGVINVGDRRATANYSVMFDRAEKVLPLDDCTLLAISGSFARAMDVVRYLRHTFKLFERSQLQPMSLDGKLSELAKVIAAGIPAALQGIGGVIPLLSTFDHKSNEGRIFFYDGMGARFESAEYGAAGSGSAPIRGCFDYIVRTRGPFSEMSRDEALKEALILLGLAADLDAATGGWQKYLPLAKTITKDGIADVSEADLKRLVQEIDHREQ